MRSSRRDEADHGEVADGPTCTRGLGTERALWLYFVASRRLLYRFGDSKNLQSAHFRLDFFFLNALNNALNA